jgi:outer membrane protein OmpA-like peptidoglycan-associated protein
MKPFLCLIVAASLTGCAAIRAPHPVTDGIGRYVFDYNVTGGRAANIVQVFDDGTKTYVQFNGFAQIRPVIRTAGGSDLPYERSGPYAIVVGVHDRLTIVVALATAEVTSERRHSPVALPDSAKSPSIEPKPAPGGAVDAGQYAALTDFQVELSRGPKIDLASSKAALLAEQQRHATKQRSTYVVRFADNSTLMEIDSAALDELKERAGSAKSLTITGYTDSAALTLGASSLALRRALAVRKLLYGNGARPVTVQVRYYGAGRFVADNNTEEGRAANRRVEIQFEPEVVL